MIDEFKNRLILGMFDTMIRVDYYLPKTQLSALTKMNSMRVKDG